MYRSILIIKKETCGSVIPFHGSVVNENIIIVSKSCKLYKSRSSVEYYHSSEVFGPLIL